MFHWKKTLALVALVAMVGPGAAAAVDPAIRAEAGSSEEPEQLIRVAADAGFNRWIDGFRGRAMAKGITAAT
ncbi:MAG: hypothetical protein WBH04_11545, partial [Albidovulum sp.]